MRDALADSGANPGPDGTDHEGRRLMAFFDQSPAEPAEIPVHYHYEGYYPGSTLDRISKMDPDGGDREPTEADYAAFQAWAVANYGQDARGTPTAVPTVRRPEDAGVFSGSRLS
jgi:hypothetical protein